MDKLKQKSKQKKLVLLLILVLTISIGYAAIATTLKINGTSTVKGVNWSVYWDNVNITDGSVTGTNVTTVPTTTGTTTTEVNFAVTLPEPGDYYEFTVDAVNAGSIDAMIAENGILNKVYADSAYTEEATLPKVLKYTVTYADGTEIQDKHLLAKKEGNTPTREKYKVRVEYRNDEEINPSDLDNDNDHTYYFKFSVNYVQADSTAIDKNASAIHYVSRQNEGQITPGDIIGIGETEDFYVISSDSTKTVLLAKYNLLVGYSNNESTNYEETYMSPSTPGYGLQSVDAIGYDGNYYYATVAFSSTNYWDDSGTLLSPYNANGASYEGNPKPFVYNSSLTTAPDFENDGWNTPGYSIAYYVEQYKTKLIERGAPSTITGRLLTFEEATSLGCDANENTCPEGSFITKTPFWLGSAVDINYVWYVYNFKPSFTYDNYDNGNYYGVRPVIEIPTSEIK